MWELQISITFRRSSNTYRKSWEFKKDTNPSVSEPRRPTSWCVFFHVFVNDGSNPSWTGLREESGDLQVHELWTDREFILYHSKFSGGTILQKYQIWRRLNPDPCAGQGPLWHMIRWKVCQWQKCESIQILYCVLGKCLGEEAKTKWSNQVKEFQVYCPVEEFLVSMVKQLNSRGIFSLDSRHCRFYNRSRMTRRVKIRHQDNSLTGSSSCPCSTTSNGPKQIMMTLVLGIQNK